MVKANLVDRIDGAGRYQINSKPVQFYDGVNIIRRDFPLNLIGYHIIEELIKRFPEISVNRFVEEHKKFLRKIPARLEPVTLKNLSVEEKALYISTEGEYNNNEYNHIICQRCIFDEEPAYKLYKILIEDIGKFILCGNKLKIEESEDRNAKLSVSLFKGLDEELKYIGWMADIEYKGDRPGKLVQAVIEMLNRNHNIWKIRRDN